MSTLDLTLIIILGSGLLLSVLIFFLTGVYKVKEGYEMVIEKTEQFYKVCPKGNYFFFPVIYKRKAIYCILPMERNIHLLNGNELILTYQIEDVKKFHYSSRDIEKAIVDKANEVEEMNEEILKTTLNEMGVKYINIRKK